MAFTMKQNDTRPIYIAALVTDPGAPGEAPIPLDDATSVKFLMRPEGADSDAEPKVEGTMTIEDATGGIVSYTWVAADTDTNGIFNVEFEITWNDGGVETVPNNSYKQVEIKDDLG